MNTRRFTMRRAETWLPGPVAPRHPKLSTPEPLRDPFESKRSLPRPVITRALSFSSKDTDEHADVFAAQRHGVGECLFHNDRASGCNCERVKVPILSASGAWRIMGRRFKTMAAAVAVVPTPNKRAAAPTARLTRKDALPAEQARRPLASRMRDELSHRARYSTAPVHKSTA
ncbi:hypothetical protein T484DRAFT_1904601 [Baffinella frigidus]|nr:hypothetical protein T484DRAFT_1904601 [Cryptophyta sp. CCMP2293]